MTAISNKDRAEAQAMFESFRGGGAFIALGDNNVRRWLAVRDHVLASHTCPDAESDSRVQAWNTIAVHPFFADCYQTEGTLVDAMVAKLDAAHTHACEPVWRPTTRDEIQPGWEVRSRYYDGREARWGTAHHRVVVDGDWYTETGAVLTWDDMSWTYETTAPLPEPEPDPRVDVVARELHDGSACEDAWSSCTVSTVEHCRDSARNLLARLDALTEGGQS